MSKADLSGRFVSHMRQEAVGRELSASYCMYLETYFSHTALDTVHKTGNYEMTYRALSFARWYQQKVQKSADDRTQYSDHFSESVMALS